MSIDEKIFQACYLGWRERQLSRQISDLFRFAYEATERELGRRQGWPAIHAATTGLFAGLMADALIRWSGIEVDAPAGHWIGSLPALIVGGVVYAVLVVNNRIWHKRLDYHVMMAIETSEMHRH